MEFTYSSEEQVTIKPFNQHDFLKKLQTKKKNEPNIQHSFQELGVAMCRHFPRRQHGAVWGLFYTYPEKWIFEAFRVCREKNIYQIAFLIGCLNQIKKSYGHHGTKTTDPPAKPAKKDKTFL